MPARKKSRIRRRVQNRKTERGVAIGARIKAERLRLGLTKTELAREAGVTIAMIMRYEHGHSIAGVDKMEALAAALGVTIGHLVGEGIAA